MYIKTCKQIISTTLYLNFSKYKISNAIKQNDKANIIIWKFSKQNLINSNWKIISANKN